MGQDVSEPLTAEEQVSRWFVANTKRLRDATDAYYAGQQVGPTFDEMARSVIRVLAAAHPATAGRRTQVQPLISVDEDDGLVACDNCPHPAHVGWCPTRVHGDPCSCRVAARPSGDAHGELDARLWHSAVCKNAAARPSGLATLTCNHCGDDLTVSELEGHLLSEGRVIPGLDAANPAPAALTADEVLIAAQKAGIDWWGTEDGGVTFVTPDPAAAEAPWWPLGDPARMAKLDAWAEKYVLAESREGEEGT